LTGSEAHTVFHVTPVTERVQTIPRPFYCLPEGNLYQHFGCEEKDFHGGEKTTIRVEGGKRSGKKIQTDQSRAVKRGRGENLFPGREGKHDEKNITDTVPRTRDKKKERWTKTTCALGSV
jgi:hypothetical protein